MPNPNTRLQHEHSSGVVYTGHGKDYITCHWYQPNVKGVEETYAFKCDGDLACCGPECCTPIPAGIPLWLLILLLLLLALLLLALCLGILYYCLKFCKRKPKPPRKPSPPPPSPPPPKPNVVKSSDGRSTVLRESREETDGREADIDSLTDGERRRKAVKTGSLSSLYRAERERELARLKELEEQRLRLEQQRSETDIAFRDRNADLANADDAKDRTTSPKLKRRDRHPSYTRLNPDWWRHDDDRQMLYDPETDTYAPGPRGERNGRVAVSAQDWTYPGQGGQGGADASFSSSQAHYSSLPQTHGTLGTPGSPSGTLTTYTGGPGGPGNGAIREVHSAKYESSAVEEKVFVPSPMEESFLAAPKAINVRPRDESEISTEQRPLLNHVDPADEQKAQFMYYRPFEPSPMEEVNIPAPARPTLQHRHVSEISTPQLPATARLQPDDAHTPELINNRPSHDDVPAY